MSGYVASQLAEQQSHFAVTQQQDAGEQGGEGVYQPLINLTKQLFLKGLEIVPGFGL